MMRRKQIRRGVATEREAVQYDLATLQAEEIEASELEGRPSLWREATAAVPGGPDNDGQPARPSGVLPSAAHGRALHSYIPENHMAIANAPVLEGWDGLFYYEPPAIKIDEDGNTMERPHLPTKVRVDGVEVTVERTGREMTEDDFKSREVREVRRA